MGDESKETMIEQGNHDPLHATRKPSTARSIEERVDPSAVIPTAEELKRRDADKTERS